MSLLITRAFAQNTSFDSWVKDFKNKAVNSGISEIVVEDFMDGVKFLPKVIEYDRFQPEFYEDTALTSENEQVKKIKTRP